MNLRNRGMQLMTGFATLALGVAIGMAADAPKEPLDPQARQAEIAAQPEGIHKLSDGSICIKSGPGLAIVNPDGQGCGVGPNAPAAAVEDGDVDLMAGVYHALFLDPAEGKKLGITADRATKIKDAYNYMDGQNTMPQPVLPLFQKYSTAEGKAKTDALKALMDKVHDIGQSFLDADAKKLKDAKALLTPDQAQQLQAIGIKMIHPVE